MKRYKCLSKYYYAGTMFGKIYDATYTWGNCTYMVEKLVKLYPEEWELVEDDFVLPEKWCIAITNTSIGNTVAQWAKFEWYKNSPKYVEFIYSDRTFSTEKNANYTEITFEQFKQHVLKQDIMKKKIIGYKLKESCKLYTKAACLIEGYITFGTSIEKCQPILFSQVDGREEGFNKLRKAGVLDLWFEPVYEEEKKLPKINSYDGAYNAKDNTITYGCAKLSVEALVTIYKCRELGGNRSIAEITLDSNVIITMPKIKEIIDYVDSQNKD